MSTDNADETRSDSSDEESTTQEPDTEQVGSLGDVLPEPLQPLWRPVETVYDFRRKYGETYVKVLEAILALALTGGYVWWLYLFLTG